MGDPLSYPQYPSQQPYPTSAPQPAWQAGEPPLWAPYYGAPFPVAVKRFFTKYAVFSGRASRSEYWWWALVGFLISMVFSIIGYVSESSAGTVLSAVWLLGTFIPSLALTVRRLHDANFSGWMLLIALVPFAGVIALLVFTLLPANPAGQRFDRPIGY